jgi:hypothetical protein
MSAGAPHATISLLDVLLDPALLGAALGDASSWSTWLAVLAAAFGLPLTAEQAAIFASVAGGRTPPSKRVRELWAIAGRRSGKSRMAAALACFIALFIRHTLAAGERGLVLVLAASIDQAKVVFSYARAFLTASPVLAQEIEDITANEIRLKNGIIIGIHSNSYKTVRGRSLCGCIFDEAAFWRDETSAVPDVETYTAVLPALATTNGMLIGISTPYRKLGLLHQKHRDYFGKDDEDTLVVRAASQVFNPLLADAVIAAQRMADPTAAGSEWDAEFRVDISAFLDDATIDRAVDYVRPLELAPRPGCAYRAMVDASGGRHDHYTVAIGHQEHGCFIIDALRGVAPPFDPGSVTQEFANLVKQYRCGEVTGDAYGAEWTERAWSKDNGVRYVRSDIGKSDIYIETLALFTRGLVVLPDHSRLLRELRLLERRTHRSGRDTVDHGRGGSDDYANAVCGVLQNLAAVTAPLWEREALGVPVPMPPGPVDLVYTVLVADKDGRAAAVHFATSRMSRPGSPITLLDCASDPLTPALLRGVCTRLIELSAACPVRAPAMLFATSALAAELERLGYLSEIIDGLLKDEMLAVSAATHIAAQRVQMCSDVLTKAYPLSFLQGAAVQDDDDPLRLAFLAGVAVALDTNRSLGRAAA